MKLELERNGYLTERDKRLLAVLCAALLLFVLGWGVLRPLAQKNSGLAAEVTAAEAERSEREQKLKLLPSQRTLNQTLLDRRTAALARYYPWMESQDIDRLLTGYALGRGLSALDLSIVMPTAMQALPAYAYSSLYSADDTAQDEASGLYTAQVTMRLSGSREGLQGLIDDLYANAPSLRITAYSWGSAAALTQLPDTAGADAAADDAETLTLSLEVYMAGAGA